MHDSATGKMRLMVASPVRGWDLYVREADEILEKCTSGRLHFIDFENLLGKWSEAISKISSSERLSLDQMEERTGALKLKMQEVKKFCDKSGTTLSDSGLRSLKEAESIHTSLKHMLQESKEFTSMSLVSGLKSDEEKGLVDYSFLDKVSDTDQTLNLLIGENTDSGGSHGVS